MTVEVRLPPSLQSALNGVNSFLANGSTVGECLANLVKQYPQLKPSLFTRDRKLNKKLSVFVNAENIHPRGLDKPVRDGDILYIIDILAGG